MSRFIWANDHQIIDVEKISVVNVNQDGKTGTAFILGHQEPITLSGSAAQDFLASQGADLRNRRDQSRRASRSTGRERTRNDNNLLAAYGTVNVN
jgi:Fe-S cluster assembly ATPase SufC